MKKFTLFVLFCLLFTDASFSQVNFTANSQVTPYTGRFRAGVNLGYYPLWGNQQMAAISAGDPAQNQIGVGGRAVRQGLPDVVLGNPLYGYNFLRADFDYYNSLNMSNGEAVAILGDPAEWHRDQTNYCPSQPSKKSKFFANMYTPIWDGGANGTPYNDNNYWAAYLYNVVNAYKDDVRFWEVWNEPGLDFGACGWRPPGDPLCNWWDRDPSPCELDLGAPIEHYVRALRIAYEVIKTVDPDSYVCLGSMGYAAGLDAVLRNTDNPNGGGVTAEYPLYGGAYFDCVTMHTYPHFDGSTLNFDGGIFQRHSDRAADGVFLFRDTYQSILNNYGYNGTTYPRKEWIITEANVPRHSYPAGQYIAGEQAQINFIQKAWIVSKLERIGSYHVYQLFDRKLPQNANYEFDEMGLYKTVEPNGTNTVGPFGQQVNEEGKAFKTVSDMLFNTDYDAVETAKMGLSTTSATRGYAFKRPDGKFVYVLWARTQTDLSENASATYSFPASMNVGTLTRHNWDWGYTQTTTQVGSTNIFLNATPVYFVGGQAPTICSIGATVTGVTCNNNGTPDSAADDTYTFNVTVNSAGPCAASGWTATAGVTGTGTYGTAKSFGPFPISGGNKVITIRDNTTTTATTSVTAFAPPTCSGGTPTCVVTAAVSNVLCNNNGTSTDPADDTYTFTLTVNQNGSCGATGWTASGGLISTGSYGTPKQFGPFPISSGGRSFTVSDVTSSAATTAVAVSAPASCSTPPATCNNNLLGNPDFNSGLNSWTPGTGVTAVSGGVGNTGAVSHCTNGQRFFQTVASSTIGTYVFQAQVRTDGNPATGTLALKFMNSSWAPLLQEFAPIPATTTFQNYSVQGVAPAGTAYIEVSVLKETGTGCLIVDDACLGIGGVTPTPTVSITCPNNITVTAASGATTAVVNYTTPTASATNCGSSPTVTRTQGLASGSAFPVGTTTVTYSATCGTANSSCSFTVTVNSNTPSTTVTFASCPQNITVTAAQGATGAVATYSTPTATTTNCSTSPTVTRISGLTSGSTFPIGTTNVVWTATCGTATATCSFTVTVQQGQGGTCQNSILLNDGFETGAFSPWNAESGSTIVSGGNVGGSYVASLCNNGFRIYQTRPAIANQNYTFLVNSKLATTAAATGTLAIKFLSSTWTPIAQEFAPLAPTSTWNSYFISKIAPAGTAYVEVSVIKESGTGCLLIDDTCLGSVNASTCSITVAITNILCNNNNTPNNPADDTFTYDATLSSSGSCSNLWSAGTSPNIVTGAYGVPTTFGPFLISSGGVLAKFVDSANGAATANAFVNPPATCSGSVPTVSINCPASINATAAAGTTSAVVTYSTPTATATNCATAPVLTRTSGLASGASFPVGSTTVVYSATACGVTSTCSFVVTVSGSTPPQVCTNSILSDGGFEQPFSLEIFWTRDNPASTTVVSGGANGSANATSICGNGNRIYQTKAATPGLTYSLQAYAKQSGGPASGVLVLKFLNSSWAPLGSDFGPVNSTTTDYKLFTVEEIAPAGTAYVEVSILKQTGTGCLFVDDICLSTGGGSTPTISLACPANLTVNIPAGQTTTSINYPAPVPTVTNCNETPLVLNLIGPSGATSGVPTGIYTPVWQAVACGVSTTCTFNITVQQSNTSGGAIDLSLTASASPQSPGIWANTAITLTVTNAGPQAATGVVVKTPAQNNATFADALAYSGHNAAAGTSYDSWLGNWNIGTIPAGQSRTLTYNAFTKTASSIPFFAQVSAANETDGDSQPNNNTTGTPAQDDEARVNINGPLNLISSNAPSANTADQPDPEAFVVYPNPAGDYAYINAEPYLKKQVQISVVNQMGKVVEQEMIDALSTPILEMDLRNYENGMYFIQIATDGQRTITKKLIVARTY